MRTLSSILMFVALLGFPSAQASAMTTQEFFNELESLESKIMLLQEQLAAAASTTIDVESTNFSVTVNNKLVHTSTVGSTEQASKRCEALAFDSKYMWKMVTCSHNGNTIYSDIFVAG